MEEIKNHPLYRNHTIDSAMSTLWDFYIKNFVQLFIISFIMGLILQYLSSLIKFDMTDYQSLDINAMMNQFRKFIWPMIVISISGLLFNTVLQYYIIYNPIDKESGILKCIVRSLKYFIPYLIIIILFAFAASFALLLGLLLFVIGILFAAIYVMMIYLFFLPVMMVEGPSISNTISRSIRLSHHNFWSNLGWTAVFLIIILVVTTVLSGLILLPFTGKFLQAFTKPEEAASLLEITSNPLYIILSGILNAITLPLLPIFACILYFNGRAREEVKSDWMQKEDNGESKVRVEDLYAKPIDDSNPENSGSL